MPRWTLYTIEGALSPDEKQSIATQVTNLYSGFGLPAFFVNVFFNEFPPGGYFCGGKADHQAIFFHIDHAARPFESEEERLGFIEKIDAIVRPIFEPKLFKWEFNVYIHPGDNWRINGMIPPIQKPDVLQQWVEKNQAIPY